MIQKFMISIHRSIYKCFLTIYYCKGRYLVINLSKRMLFDFMSSSMFNQEIFFEIIKSIANRLLYLFLDYIFQNRKYEILFNLQQYLVSYMNHIRFLNSIFLKYHETILTFITYIVSFNKIEGNMILLFPLNINVSVFIKINFHINIIISLLLN